jgi:hypothetical protein
MSAVSTQASDSLQKEVILDSSTLNIAGLLLDIYKSEPHSHYAAGAQGMTNISVGDLEIAAPSKVNLPVRTPWNENLKTPERSYRSDETQMDTNEYLNLMNPV